MVTQYKPLQRVYLRTYWSEARATEGMDKEEADLLGH